MTSHVDVSEPVPVSASSMNLAATEPTKLTNRNSRSSPTYVSSSDQDHDLFASIPRKNKFTAWKRKKDSKIVGLKNYGLDSPRHQLHNVLSEEEGCGSNSVATQDHLLHKPQYHSSSRSRLFAVEKEEEIVRQNVTKNPCMLFYLGNVAALKVLIYYFSTYSFEMCDLG
jgi:hypothetical protein